MIELQAWYSESWWPKLNDNDNLVSVLTILIWNAYPCNMLHLVLDNTLVEGIVIGICGACVLPFELLVPSSGPGVTCRCVLNSVST
ncbi:lipoxygenase, putative [Medicago truncatula]|uniref:Lipoxygenase, putative n=1 Tax=Medicago truncatula TaxID=3880 RepID=A0A072TGE7_MEDTR|nr:lipoxygenase, putative [Medicago truncatula]